MWSKGSAGWMRGPEKGLTTTDIDLEYCLENWIKTRRHCNCVFFFSSEGDEKLKK
jgi:hypothetical protein